MFRVTGTKIDIKTLAKKIANMKTRLKKKSDIHRTGNKPIKLSISEVKLAGAISAGIKQTLSTSVAETNDSLFNNSLKNHTIFSLSPSDESYSNVKSSCSKLLMWFFIL